MAIDKLSSNDQIIYNVPGAPRSEFTANKEPVLFSAAGSHLSPCSNNGKGLEDSSWSEKCGRERLWQNFSIGQQASMGLRTIEFIASISVPTRFLGTSIVEESNENTGGSISQPSTGQRQMELFP
jgi:hypothetical protein